MLNSAARFDRSSGIAKVRKVSWAGKRRMERLLETWVRGVFGGDFENFEVKSKKSSMDVSVEISISPQTKIEVLETAGRWSLASGDLVTSMVDAESRFRAEAVPIFQEIASALKEDPSAYRLPNAMTHLRDLNSRYGLEATCPRCDGRGSESCPECSGSGKLTCRACSRGQSTCDPCRG